MKRTTPLLLAAAAGGALLWRRAARDGPSADILDADQARALYDRLAPVYDGVAGAYALLGARRLHTILTTLLEDLLFEVPDGPHGDAIEITAADVDDKLAGVVKNRDLSQYIL